MDAFRIDEIARRLLERTREKLEALEARLATLESGAPGSVTPPGSGSGAAPTG